MARVRNGQGLNMKIQVEIDVPADMIVYDVGQDLIRCNRCNQTARTELSGNTVAFMSNFLRQHVASCITREPSSVPRPIIDRRPGNREDGWLCVNKPVDGVREQGLSK